MSVKMLNPGQQINSGYIAVISDTSPILTSRIAGLLRDDSARRESNFGQII